MFLGHYGIALAAKSRARRTSLGTLVLAAQLLDLMWPPLLLAGLERVRIQPGLMAASALDFEHYPISHSLAMAAVWAALAGGIYYVARRYVAGAWVVAGLVLSHWLLDAPFHRPDLPLWPGSSTLVGGGLWNSLPITIVAELAVLGIGLAAYTRATRPIDRTGTWALWSGAALLVVFYLGSLVSVPPSASAIAFGGLALWLFVPWGWWVDRHRAPRTDLLSNS
jgi:membrane-bound metal-dependent hydrolase YbcI (DUF457 family)